MLKDAKAKAAEAAISAARAAGRHRRAVAEAEYEAATDKLLFTKDFNDEFEARMHDKLATVTERVRAWVLRYSWGSWALFAIEQDGYPRHQVDCVNELGIGKNRVSKAVSYLQQRGYMADHPKELRPICSPKLTVPAPRTSAFAQFVELYKVAPSTEWRALEVARSEVKRLRKVMLSEFKKSEQQKTKAAATLLETVQSSSQTSPAGGPPPLEHYETRGQTPAENRPETGGMQSRDRAAAFLFAEIAQMQRAYPETGFATPPINPTDRNDQVLVNRILDALGAHDQDHLLGFVVHVAAKFKGFAWGGTKRTPRAPGSPTGPHSVVLLVNWAQDYARVANMSKCRAKPGRQAVEDNEDLRGQAEDGSDEAKKSRGVASWEEMGKTECQERMKRALKSLEGERGWKLLTPDQRYARAETAARHQLCEELRAERGASAQADTNG